MIETVSFDNNPTIDIPSALIISKNLDIGDTVNMLVDYDVMMVDEEGIRIKISNIQTRIGRRKY